MTAAPAGDVDHCLVVLELGAGDLNRLAASVARTVAGLVASAAEGLGRIRRPGRHLGLRRP